MAHEQRRVRTVVVRMRPVVFRWARGRMVRRLLVLAGMMMGGWLLGGGVHASAGTLPAPGTGSPHAVLRTVAGFAGAEPGLLKDGGSGEHTGTSSESTPAAVTGIHGAASQALRGARRTLPISSPTVLGSPGRVWRAVTGLASIGSWRDVTGPGLPWTPWHRNLAVAGTGERTGAQLPGALAASGASKDGWVLGAARTQPAPFPGAESPRPAPRSPAETLLAVAGPILMGGGLAHIPRTAAAARSKAVQTPRPGAAAPAIRSATDEPSFSPD
ncbi:MAG: hypothetical protein JWO67_658 [Streptosporangiaceae bacterium]|nr:hypothetical protein [Streptosporangiaceae bacterium]